MTRFWLMTLAAGGGVAVATSALLTRGTDALWMLLLPWSGLLVGVVSSAEAERKVRVGLVKDSDGKPTRYTLSLGGETVTLDPGRAWIQADAYKWVTRGLLEEPQSYHVQPDGTVEINGEKIELGNPSGPARLEHEINKRHSVSTAMGASAHVITRKPSGPPRDPTKVTFRVKVDHLSHLLIECLHGEDRMETGLRGMMTLVENGLMRRPREMHVDPLQRWIEIEGQRFTCTEEDAARLGQLLNAAFAPKLRPVGEGTIEIKDNPASATGFDIHFVSFHGGMRSEVKGHLTQDRLNQLQDDQHCGLMQHGILFRLSPPNLLIRRRRQDGGEERIPEIPDVQYRRIKAAELQRILNNPQLRRTAETGNKPGEPPVPAKASTDPETGRPDTPPEAPPPSAVPHPARPVSLVAAAVPVAKPAPVPVPTPTAPVRVVPEGPAGSPVEPPLTKSAVPSITPPRPPEDQGVSSGDGGPGPFSPQDPTHIIGAVFSELARHVEVPIQEVHLSLPRVFHDRRFVVINFGGFEVSDLAELRSEEFYGFYLSYLEAQHPILVYACRGRHLEWGHRKCVVQPSITGEPEEFPGSALLGMAQDSEGNFVFVVTADYRMWVRSKERDYRPVCVRFMTPEEYRDHAVDCTLIWPESSST